MAQKTANRERKQASRAVTVVVVGGLLAALAGFWGYPWVTGYTAWRRAWSSLEEDNVDEARVFFEQCAKIWPNDVDVQLQTARACRRTDDSVAAKDHLQAAVRLNEAQQIEGLAPTISLEMALQEAQFGDIHAVESDLYRLLMVGHCDEVLIMEALAKSFLQKFQLNNVVKCAGMWNERYPQDWRPKYYWGAAYEKAGDAENAINRFRAVVELKPDHFDTRQRLGALLRRAGAAREALVHMQYCYEHQPDSPDVVIELSNCLIMLARADEARQALDRWISAHGQENASVLQARGEVEIETVGPAAGLPWLRRAERLAPQDHLLITLLARALREAGQNDEAAKYEERRDEINKLLKRLEDILRDLVADTENIPLRYEAGTILIRLGRPPQALRWFRSVLDIDPNHRETHLALADYYESIGEKERAQNHRKTAEGKMRAKLEH
jgi:tetratricopeptide (TPR) repeat protein